MASNQSQLAASSSSPLLNEETASIRWVLNNFNTLTGQHYSSIFSPPNNPSRDFRLGLNLNLDPETPYTQNINIYLRPPQTSEQFRLKYDVSILDSQRRKLYTKQLQCSYDMKYDYPFCFASFIDYSRLIDRENRFIHRNKLTLFCEVRILNTGIRSVVSKMFVSNLQTLLQSGEFSDLSLMVGEREFKVHKNILAARSEVFRAMFRAENGNQNIRVHQIDMNVHVFEQLLAYIYSGVVPSTNELTMELFVAAGKYQLHELKTLCRQALITTLTTETVVNILLEADLHAVPELKLDCIKFITANSVQVMATNKWTQLLQSNRTQLMGELYADFVEASNSGD